jgi:hypothetical protein
VTPRTLVKTYFFDAEDSLIMAVKATVSPSLDEERDDADFNIAINPLLLKIYLL